MTAAEGSSTKPMIFAAMAKVMDEVGAIGKAKKNLQQGYQFRGIDDVVAVLQPVMAKHGVLCVPEVLERERETLPTKSGGTQFSVRLLVRHTFYAADGSNIVCTTLGEAMDSGDKASNKAMSAALKYALTEGLLIPTYEADRDTEESSPEVGKPEKAKAAPKATAAPKEDALSTEAIAIIAAAKKAATVAELEALRPRYDALKGTPEHAKVGTELAKRKADLTPKTAA